MRRVITSNEGPVTPPAGALQLREDQRGPSARRASVGGWGWKHWGLDHAEYVPMLRAAPGICAGQRGLPTGLETVDLTRESSCTPISHRSLYRRCERLVTSTGPHGCDRGCDQDGSQLARRGETRRDCARAHTEASGASELQRRLAKTALGLLITQRSQVQILPPLLVSAGQGPFPVGEGLWCSRGCDHGRGLARRGSAALGGTA